MPVDAAPTPDYDPYALSSADIKDPPQSLWLALRNIGPGIILAGSIVGSGELIATTALGAEFGYTFLWLIIFSCFIKVFVQIELGRYAISCGKPTLAFLNTMPGLKIIGAHWQVWWWLGMLAMSVTQMGAMVGGVGQALELVFQPLTPHLVAVLGGGDSSLGGFLKLHPEDPWAAITAPAAIALLLSGGYKRLEGVTTLLVAGVTLVTVLCVAVLPWTGFPFHLDKIANGFMFHVPAAGLAIAVAVFGITGVGASELYTYPYWCIEKGYARFVGPRDNSPEWVRRARGWMNVLQLDAWFSMLVFTVATVAFYMLGATVLEPQHLVPKGNTLIKTLAEMYVPTFGTGARIAFLIGAWAVLFKTLYVASAGHSRLTADFFNLAGWVDYSSEEHRYRVIRWLCVFFPMLSLTLYYIFREPKTMVVWGGIAQAITLPVITGAAIFFRYRRLDARIRPHILFDVFTWFAFVSMTILSLTLAWNKVADLVHAPKPAATATENQTPGVAPASAGKPAGSQ